MNAFKHARAANGKDPLCGAFGPYVRRHLTKIGQKTNCPFCLETLKLSAAGTESQPQVTLGKTATKDD